jgi:hypothetical protein
MDVLLLRNTLRTLYWPLEQDLMAFHFNSILFPGSNLTIYIYTLYNYTLK